MQRIRWRHAIGHIAQTVQWMMVVVMMHQRIAIVRRDGRCVIGATADHAIAHSRQVQLQRN